MKSLWFSLLLVGPLSADTEAPAEFVDYVRQHPDGEAAYSFNHAPYKEDLNRLPIGVFDSGIGGLTVLEAIFKLDAFNNGNLRPGADGKPDFQDERFIYFGDQANMPYGNYAKAGRTDYLRERILKDAAFLLGNRYALAAETRHDKPPVKAIVIACNTATAFGLEDVRNALKVWGVPIIVVGVVEAGARGVRDSESHPEHALAVLATAGTCESGAYPRMITRALGLAGKPVPDIVQQGGVNFAGVIEGDTKSGISVADEALAEVRRLLDRHREGGAAKPVGKVVLGCTHYPLAIGEINAAFEKLRSEENYSGMIAPELVFVDPAEWTAKELFRELASARLRMRAGETCVMLEHRFYMTVANADSPTARIASDGSLEHDYKYSRKPGNFELIDTKAVPMLPNQIPATSQRLLETRLPLVWARLAPAAATASE